MSESRGIDNDDSGEQSSFLSDTYEVFLMVPEELDLAKRFFKKDKIREKYSKFVSVIEIHQKNKRPKAGETSSPSGSQGEQMKNECGSLRCLICLKVFNCLLGVTSNIAKHLRVEHNIEVNDQPINDENQEIIQKRFGRAITEFFIDSKLPLHHVEKGYFRKPLSIANSSKNLLKMPSRPALMIDIKQLFSENREDLRAKLSKVDVAVATADFWSTYGGRAYLGMTIHWIDAKSLHRHNDVLACHRVLGKKTYDVVAKSMKEGLDSVGARMKVKHIIVDGGSNIKKALKEFGAPNDPQLELLDGLAEIFVADESNSDELGSHAECGAHALNLASSSDVLKYCKNDETFLELQTSSFKKLKRLWALQHYSSLWSEEIKKRFKTLLKVGCDTRWFSFYEAVADFIKKSTVFPQQMNEMFDSHQKPKKKGEDPELMKLTSEEMQFLVEYMKV